MNWKGTSKLVLLACSLAMGAILLTPASAGAATINGPCGYNAEDCSSNDLQIISLGATPDLLGDDSCSGPGDTIDLIISTELVVRSGALPEAQQRYDVGFYAVFDEVGNQCIRGVMDDGNTSPGVFNDDDDDCGDLSVSALTMSDTFAGVPCTDDDGDFHIDPFTFCQSWGNNPDQIGTGGCDVTDVQTGTNPKCDCQTFDPGITLPGCGNGIIEKGEECDDENQVSDDGCSDQCIIEFCGDGIVNDGDEECDPGAPAGNGPACSCDPKTCTFTSDCGNGVVECGEECDDENKSNTDNCLATCENAECGDGFVQEGVEQCDDADKVDNDECGNDCALPACGNGEIELKEQCDDGNLTDLDGCSANCTVEVPTTGEYGLGALALLLLGAGIVASRKGNLI